MSEEPSRAVRAACVAGVVLPIVTAVVRALRHDWYPVGDAALLAVRVRDVATTHHPLLGSWTSASLSVGRDINNPGPLYQDLVAPVAKLVSPGGGIAIAVGLANALAAVGISAAARHIGGWSLQRWALLAAAAMSWTMGSELLFDIWQPHALLLPFVAFLFLTLGIATGRGRCVPWAVLVGSLLVQTHIGYAYVVAAFVPVAAGLAWFRARPVRWAELRPQMRSPTAAAAIVVGVLVWTQPVVDQFAGEGNLGNLLASSGGGERTLGWSNAAKIVAGVVALPPWWLRRGFSTIVPNTPLTDGPGGPELHIATLPGAALTVAALVLLLAVLAGLAVRCRRSGLAIQAAAMVLCAAGVIIAVGTLAALTVGRVGFAAHHVRWVWPFAVFAHVCAAWAIASLVATRVAPRRAALAAQATTAVALGLAALLTLLDLPADAQQQGPTVDAGAIPVLHKVFPHLGVLRAGAPVVFDIANLRVFEPYSTAVMLDLQDRGIEFRVTDHAMLRQLGEGRRADGTETTTIFQLEDAAALLYDGPACAIAVESGVADSEARRARQDAAALAGGWSTGIVVEPSTLTADELAAVEAAATGDVGTARQLVLQGDLERWWRAGGAQIDPALVPDPAAALAGITRWVLGTYGVFAQTTEPPVCGG